MAPTLIPKISTESLGFRRLSNDQKRKYHKLSSFSCMSLIVNKMIGTGIFSTPAIIFQYCEGNIPIFLGLWLLGGIVVFAGLFIFLEFALNLPFVNGGEKNYLLRSFGSPKGLSGCIYAFQMVLLGFSSGNAFAFGKYVLYAFGYESQSDSDWYVKLVGVACISWCIFLHIKFPSQGTKLFNFLGAFKILILVLIIIIGAAVSLGSIDLDSNTHSTNIEYQSSTPGFYSISIALLEIIYSFKGWENANYVLSEVSDPYQVLTVSAPLAVLTTVILYFLVIISYLIVIPKQELMQSGVLVAGVFFTKVFGKSLTSHILPILIAISNLGNVLVVSFAHGHVNQELARSNYLPFSKYFTDLKHALTLHWFITVLVLVAPPSSAIYEFVVNLYIYPGTWINLSLTVGLFFLKINPEANYWGKYKLIPQRNITTSINVTNYSSTNNESDGEIDINEDEDSEIHNIYNSGSSYTDFESLISSPLNVKVFSSPYILLLIFFIANVFMALFPFIPPPKNSPGDLSPIPYWCFPVIGTSVLALGGVWFFSRSWYYNKLGAGSPPRYFEDL